MGPVTWYSLQNFNPRLPRGKRQLAPAITRHPPGFQSTLLRGKRHKRTTPKVRKGVFQSTLPARKATKRVSALTHFSFEFQSTLPAGEATAASEVHYYRYYDFNPRFPRGKRHPQLGGLHHGTQISIHASREGSDFTLDDCLKFGMGFQSTLPAREATK